MLSLPTTKKSKKIKTIIIIIIILLLAVACGGVYAWRQMDDSTNPKSDQDKSSGSKDESTKDTSSNGSNNSSSDSLPDKTQNQPQTSSNNSLQSLTQSSTLEAPSLERASQSGATLKVVATLQGDTSDKCILHLSQSNSIVEYSSSFVVGPSYYVCSFDIPVSELPLGNSWTAQVLHVNGNNYAVSNTSEVVITK